MRKTSLLHHPLRPVAVVLNSGSTDPDEIADKRAQAHRLLARGAPTGWHVALAVPKLNAWVKTDPAVKAYFDSDPLTKKNYNAQAIQVLEFTKNHPFDPSGLRKNREFQGLLSFLNQFVTMRRARVAK